MTPWRAGGVAPGFTGVVVLVSGSLGAATPWNSLWGQAAVLAASVSYAPAATFARRHLRGRPLILQATLAVCMADAMLELAVPAVARPLRLPTSSGDVAGPCLAWPPGFFGLLLGVGLLGEPLSPRLIGGTLLVVSGIAIAGRVPASTAGLGRVDLRRATTR